MPEVRSCFGTRGLPTFYRSHIAFENDEVFQECENHVYVEIGVPREVFAEYEARVWAEIATESYTSLKRETASLGAANRFAFTTRDAEEGEVREEVETHDEARSLNEEEDEVANPRRRSKDIGGAAFSRAPRVAVCSDARGYEPVTDA